MTLQYHFGKHFQERDGSSFLEKALPIDDLEQSSKQSCSKSLEERLHRY
jgi:hypothetical protein